MDNFMSEAIVLEAVLVSVLLTLWITWLLMRGLFKLMPATSSPTASGPAPAIRPIQSHRQEDARCRAA